MIAIQNVCHQLNEQKQQAVLDLASYQLEGQKKESNISFPNTKKSKASKSDDDSVLVAAHMKDNLSEKEMGEVFAFIHEAKQKEIQKKTLYKILYKISSNGRM